MHWQRWWITKDIEVFLDTDWYQALLGSTWHSCVRGNGERSYSLRHAVSIENRKVFVYLHRLVAGVPRPLWVDFLNQNPYDLRRCNLIVSSTEGELFKWESKVNHEKDASYGCAKEILWDFSCRMWSVVIGGYKYGNYKTEVEAVWARNRILRFWAGYPKQQIKTIFDDYETK